MVLKRFLSVGAAALMAVSLCLTAYADEEEAIKFEYDKDFVVSEADKVGYTLSFDKDDWKDYVKLTPDSDKAGLKISASTKRAYQGATLKVSANNSDNIADKQNFCWAIGSADADKDTEGLITMGIEIDAKDVGVTTFDGSLIIFTYRFEEAGVNALLGNSIVAFTADDDYKDTGAYSVITKNDTISNNITQYREGMINVPSSGNSTKIIIEVPVLRAYSGEIVAIDNIDICLPGDVGYIKNLDGYNENATPKETVEELEITGSKDNDTGITPSGDKDDSSDKGTSALVIVVIVLVGLVVVAGLVFLFIRLKTKFY